MSVLTSMIPAANDAYGNGAYGKRVIGNSAVGARANEHYVFFIIVVD